MVRNGLRNHPSTSWAPAAPPPQMILPAFLNGARSSPSTAFNQPFSFGFCAVSDHPPPLFSVQDTCPSWLRLLAPVPSKATRAQRAAAFFFFAFWPPPSTAPKPSGPSSSDRLIGVSVTWGHDLPFWAMSNRFLRGHGDFMGGMTSWRLQRS